MHSGITSPRGALVLAHDAWWRTRHARRASSTRCESNERISTFNSSVSESLDGTSIAACRRSATAHAAKPTPHKPPSPHLRSSVYPTSLPLAPIPPRRRAPLYLSLLSSVRPNKARPKYHNPLNVYSEFLRGTLVANKFLKCAALRCVLRSSRRLSQRDRCSIVGIH